MAIMSLKGGNVVDAVVNAVVAGYRDDLILEELANALEDETITKDQFKAAVEGLELYVARFADSIKTVSNAMGQFEFNEKTSIIKNRPLNLAQQVMVSRVL
jgi:predicted RNA-binding protein associated with RNAse of E/G family